MYGFYDAAAAEAVMGIGRLIERKRKARRQRQVLIQKDKRNKK